jgi:hypothetical protein
MFVVVRQERCAGVLSLVTHHGKPAQFPCPFKVRSSDLVFGGHRRLPMLWAWGQEAIVAVRSCEVRNKRIEGFHVDVHCC